PARASRLAARCAVVTSTSTLQSVAMYDACSALSSGLIGTKTAPARAVPQVATTVSARFSSQIPTRAARATSSDSSVAAKPLARAASSEYESDALPATSATPSGRRSADRSSRSENNSDIGKLPPGSHAVYRDRRRPDVRFLTDRVL